MSRVRSREEAIQSDDFRPEEDHYEGEMLPNSTTKVMISLHEVQQRCALLSCRFELASRNLRSYREDHDFLFSLWPLHQILLYPFSQFPGKQMRCVNIDMALVVVASRLVFLAPAGTMAKSPQGILVHLLKHGLFDQAISLALVYDMDVMDEVCPPPSLTHTHTHTHTHRSIFCDTESLIFSPWSSDLCPSMLFL